jgi:arylsulfatase A-like enzyme
MLDYAFEVEHFDKHLQRMLAELESLGQLDNTIVIVMRTTACPSLAAKVKTTRSPTTSHSQSAGRRASPAPGRIIDDYVSVIDLAPTLLEASGVAWKDSGMAPITGRSILPLLRSHRSGILDTSRDHVLLGRERNDVGRPNDEGYPIRRAIRN